MDLDHVFTYHKPSEDQIKKYEALRAAARWFVCAIDTFCPPCADATAAIRKVREALMTANASIALGGRL